MTRPDGRRGLVVAGLLALALLLRLSVMDRSAISYDDATVALVAKHYLSGEAFPAFFYRQAYMGTLAEPHFETNIFGLALLLLALAALAAEPPSARYARVLAGFGLTAGLAWWTNFKALEVILPALLALGLRDPRLPLRRAGAFLAVGFLLGSLPVWIFYGVGGHGDAVARAAQLFETRPPLSARRLGELVTTVVPSLLGGYYWLADTWPRRAALGANIAVYGVASLGLVADALRRRPGGRLGARDWGLWLVLLALVAPFALVYVSGFARRIDHETVRYILPAYTPLLLAAAALVARLWRWSRVVGAGVLAGLLADNLWTHIPWIWPHSAERAARAREVAAREGVLAHLAAHPVRALYTDDAFLALEWAFHLWRLPVSDLAAEVYLPHSLAADAAAPVVILSGQNPARVREQLDLLGTTYRRTRYGGLVLVDQIRLPPRAYRLLPRAGWRVGGDASVPPVLADGDLATGWPPEARPAAKVVVDLGAPHVVGRVVWWPTTVVAETPALAVAVSADGAAWEAIGTLPPRRPAFVAGGRPFFRPRSGWLEVRFAPRRLRYLRLAPTAGDATTPWGVTELYVYDDLGPRPDASAGPDGPTVAAALAPHGVRRLLADPAISARVVEATRGAIRTRPANGFLDNHGRYLPLARLAERVRLRPGDAALVPEEDMDELRARLGEAGLRFREEPLGDHRLVWALDPVPPRRRRVGGRRGP